jgi:hypothetical protein
MKPNIKLSVLCTLTLLTSGCVTTTTPPTETTAPPEVRVTHTVTPSAPDICGELTEFVLDIHKLDGKQQKSLLDDLSGYDGSEFSCDRLKAGLLLSQIGKTISEDNLALEILGSYQQSDRLGENSQHLLSLLVHQSQERKRLHVLLYKLGERLSAEKSQNESMSGDLLALQEKLNQLQKLEADINETEQSISAPTTSSLTTESAQNTGS